MAGDVAETWIGAGGWAYFRGPTGRSLEDYARAFRFVEVNSTFYRHPDLPMVRRWRRTVPPDFRFAVKAHRDITHEEGCRPTRRALSALARDAAIARTLGSDLLILQTPPDLRFGREEVLGLRGFAALLGNRVRIGLEARAYAGRALPRPLAAALRDAGGIDVVDLSRGHAPRVESDTVYTRLLGKGERNAWEFSDDELREIAAGGDRGVGRMVFTFHGVRMYKDAARFLSFERSGRFPPATRAVGVEAVREVLSGDARFPANRDDLLRDHGWKVIAVEGGDNVHAQELLRALPRRTFRSLPQVLQALPS